MLLGVRTYLKLAAGLGLEPRYSAPEADVLPLDDPAIAFSDMKARQGARAYHTRLFGVSQLPPNAKAPREGRSAQTVA